MASQQLSGSKRPLEGVAGDNGSSSCTTAAPAKRLRLDPASAGLLMRAMIKVQDDGSQLFTLRALGTNAKGSLAIDGHTIRCTQRGSDWQTTAVERAGSYPSPLQAFSVFIAAAAHQREEDADDDGDSAASSVSIGFVDETTSEVLCSSSSLSFSIGDTVTASCLHDKVSSSFVVSFEVNGDSQGCRPQRIPIANGSLNLVPTVSLRGAGTAVQLLFPPAVPVLLLSSRRRKSSALGDEDAEQKAEGIETSSTSVSSLVADIIAQQRVEDEELAAAGEAAWKEHCRQVISSIEAHLIAALPQEQQKAHLQLLTGFGPRGIKKLTSSGGGGGGGGGGKGGGGGGGDDDGYGYDDGGAKGFDRSTLFSHYYQLSCKLLGIAIEMVVAGAEGAGAAGDAGNNEGEEATETTTTTVFAVPTMESPALPITTNKRFLEALSKRSVNQLIGSLLTGKDRSRKHRPTLLAIVTALESEDGEALESHAQPKKKAGGGGRRGGGADDDDAYYDQEQQAFLAVASSGTSRRAAAAAARATRGSSRHQHQLMQEEDGGYGGGGGGEEGGYGSSSSFAGAGGGAPADSVLASFGWSMPSAPAAPVATASSYSSSSYSSSFYAGTGAPAVVAVPPPAAVIVVPKHKKRASTPGGSGSASRGGRQSKSAAAAVVSYASAAPEPEGGAVVTAASPSRVAAPAAPAAPPSPPLPPVDLSVNWAEKVVEAGRNLQSTLEAISQGYGDGIAELRALQSLVDAVIQLSAIPGQLDSAKCRTSKDVALAKLTALGTDLITKGPLSNTPAGQLDPQSKLDLATKVIKSLGQLIAYFYHVVETRVVAMTMMMTGAAMGATTSAAAGAGR